MADGSINFSERCTLTTTLRHFSFCGRNYSVFRDYDCDGPRFHDYFYATFYVNDYFRDRNGMLASVVHRLRRNMKGHVSIRFRGNYRSFRMFSMTFSCTASVIDASGNKRFPRSFAFHHDVRSKEDKLFFDEGFTFRNYIKCSTLLSDPSELLPGDSLTLCLEIEYEVIDRFIPISLRYDTDGFDWDDGKWYLRMDTEFSRDLCRMSTVFRDMMECPVVESGPGGIVVPREELKSFMLIMAFLDDYNLEVTFTDIHDLYIHADKYDMQRIIQLCHQLLIGVIRAINTKEMQENIEVHFQVISELAERFEDDESLREILVTYSDIKNKFEGGAFKLDASSVCKLETEWSLKLKKEIFFVPSFVFTKSSSENLQLNFCK